MLTTGGTPRCAAGSPPGAEEGVESRADSVHTSHMPRPRKLEPDVVEAWLAAHPGWAREDARLVRTLRFPDFARALAFTVELGMVAEKRDHHPDVTVGWGRAVVAWTTHDAGGLTELDLTLAEATDAIASRSAT